MRLFAVQADPDTGEWIAGTMHEIGEIDRATHDARQDTDEVHYDTSDRDGETCAVEVHWTADGPAISMAIRDSYAAAGYRGGERVTSDADGPDAGRVLAPEDADAPLAVPYDGVPRVYVAWDSGCRTWTPADHIERA